MIKKVFILISALLIVFSSVNVGFSQQNHVFRGNELYDYYTEQYSGYKIDKSKLKAVRSMWNEGFYYGYIMGIVQMLEQSNEYDVIVHKKMRRKQLADIVGNYLENHPASRHEYALDLVIQALLEKNIIVNKNK